MKLIVSLTTSPSRIPLIGNTLLSMLRQNPFQLILNIPSIFQRTNETYMTEDVFIDMMKENCIDLNEYFVKGVLKWNSCGEDLGPITKLAPIINNIPFEEDCWIVTIDDDIEYLDGILDMYRDTITKKIKNGEKVAMGMTGFRFMNNYICAVESNDFVEVLEGYGSVCYHRSFFPNHTWTQYVNHIIKDPCCKFSDDIVISNWLAMNNIKRLLVSTPWVNRRMIWSNKCVLDYGNQSDALHNGGAGIVGSVNAPDTNIQRYHKAKKYLLEKKLLSKEFSASSLL